MEKEKILIDDVGLPANILSGFNALGLTVMSATTMTESLLNWEKWKSFNPKKTVLVFPGNGGKIVRTFLESAFPRWSTEWPLVFNPSAKRIWNPGEDPRIYCNKFAYRFILGISDVVIVDDVVSSGKTCQKVRQDNSPFVPGAKWHIATWVIQFTPNIKGFESIHCHLEAGTKQKKCPVNSLSTLLQEVDIARSYAHRNFPEAQQQQFLDILNFALTP